MTNARLVIVPSLLALVALAALGGCKRDDAKLPALPVETPAFHPERGAVLEAIESARYADAEATLKDAPDTADVHYLRGKLAAARLDADTAYRELKRATELTAGHAEYQYELGVVAPLPVSGLTMEAQKSRHQEAGQALARAVALAPDEPRYLYARAFFLSVSPQDTGGDLKAGRQLFDRIVERHGDSAWADRVRFDRAAEMDDVTAAETHAAKAAEKDAAIGSRLWLMAAGTRLRTGDLEKTTAALEAAAKLSPPAAGGFCDAGQALDGGGNGASALPFWKRCLELAPDGPKAPIARQRIASTALEGKVKL